MEREDISGQGMMRIRSLSDDVMNPASVVLVNVVKLNSRHAVRTLLFT